MKDLVLYDPDKSIVNNYRIHVIEIDGKNTEDVFTSSAFMSMGLECNSSVAYCPCSWNPTRCTTFEGSVLTLSNLRFAKDMTFDKVPMMLTFEVQPHDGQRIKGAKRFVAMNDVGKTKLEGGGRQLHTSAPHCNEKVKRQPKVEIVKVEDKSF